MRLDKYLAHAGLGTRKEVKLAIRKGRVSVNGEVCRKDDRKIQEGADVVCLDKEEIYYEAVVYIMLNKPQDVVSATSDPTYETVLDCIDAFLPKDCFPVGRLDMDTEGLLLITKPIWWIWRSRCRKVIKRSWKTAVSYWMRNLFFRLVWKFWRTRKSFCISRREDFIR